MELVTKVKPNINSVEVSSQLSKYRHPLDCVQVGSSLLWPWFLSLVAKNQIHNMVQFMWANTKQVQQIKCDTGLNIVAGPYSSRIIII
jgi:hypothetical protein